MADNQFPQEHMAAHDEADENEDLRVKEFLILSWIHRVEQEIERIKRQIMSFGHQPKFDSSGRVTFDQAELESFVDPANSTHRNGTNSAFGAVDRPPASSSSIPPTSVSRNVHTNSSTTPSGDRTQLPGPVMQWRRAGHNYGNRPSGRYAGDRGTMNDDERRERMNRNWRSGRDE